MATNTTVPAIPAPTGIERNTERVLSPIKETLDVWAGRQGNPNNRVVTVRELVDLITTDATLSVTISTVPHSHTIYLEKAGGIMTGPLELDDTLKFGATGQTVNDIVISLTGAGTASQLATAAAIEGYVGGAVSDHEGATDPHTGYQLESEKSEASGYASLDGSGYVPPGELGSGTPDGTKYLRDDSTWQTITTGTDTDEKAKVSANDTTAGYFEDKIVVSAGTNTTEILELSTLNDGSDEDLQLQIDEGKIDHDGLTNTHNLSTDIDHDGLTNTHNLSTDIDHDGLTNTHNLSTDIDHDQLTNFEGGEHIDWSVTGVEDVHDDRIASSSVTQHVGSIDHNSLLNTHDLATDIDHNSITNTHNLTTDIDHSSITGAHNLTTDIDHGGISGLGDDDHSIYSLADGTRAFTGAVTVSPGTSYPTYDFTIQKTVTGYVSFILKDSASTDGAGILYDPGGPEVFLFGDMTTDKADVTLYAGTGKSCKFVANSAMIANVNASGFQIMAGARCNLIDTTITAPGLDTSLVTEKAVVDYCAGLGGGGLFTEDPTSYTIYGGTGAGANLTTGAECNFLAGYNAGAAITTGDSNIVIGREAFIYNQTGGYSIAIGGYALQGADASATSLGNNIAIGYSSFRDSPNNATLNIGIGSNCGTCITGSYNTFMGDSCAFGTSPQANAANYNTAVGGYALFSVDGADDATAIGYSAGRNSTTGTYNVFLGSKAGYGIVGTKLTGGNNTILGARAGYEIQGASSMNTLIGYDCGEYISTGINNVAIGGYSGRYFREGSYNIAVGNSALSGKSSYTGAAPAYNIAIGYSALSQPDNNPTYNIAIGYLAGQYSYGNDFSIFMGYYAGGSTSGTTTQGSYNIGFGYSALKSYVLGYSNVAIGSQALQFLINGGSNIAIGPGAACYLNRDATDAGYNNVCIGSSAGCGTATGENDYADCVFIGGSAGLNHKTGTNNVAIGAMPLRQGNKSTGNVAIGNSAGYYLNEVTSSFYASENTIIGTSAARGVATTTTEFRYNVVVGARAAEVLDGQAEKNVVIGYDAGDNLSSGSRNVFLGPHAGDGLTTESDQLRIANTTIEALIEGDFADEWVRVNGDFAADNQPGRNIIINADFDYWQRGTTHSTNGFGSCDRWRISSNASAYTMSQQSFTVGQTDVPGEPTYYLRLATTTSSSSTEYSALVQMIEDVRTLAGQAATLSFYAKASTGTPNISVELAQNFGSGGSSIVDSIGVNKIALSTSWQKFVVTADIPSISGKTIGTSHRLELNFWLSAGSTYDSRTDTLGLQSVTIDFAQVQLEKGVLATPFERKPLREVQQDCARFFQHLSYIYSGEVTSGYTYYVDFHFPVIMKSQPTITGTYSGATNFAASVPTFSALVDYGVRCEKQANGTGYGIYYGTFVADAEY